MKQYKIEIAQPAAEDLLDILDYISNTLKEPVAARRIYTSIKKEILTLAFMPERNRVVDDEPYAALGVRRLFVSCGYCITGGNGRAFWKNIKSQGTDEMRSVCASFLMGKPHR